MNSREVFWGDVFVDGIAKLLALSSADVMSVALSFALKRVLIVPPRVAKW